MAQLPHVIMKGNCQIFPINAKKHWGSREEVEGSLRAGALVQALQSFFLFVDLAETPHSSSRFVSESLL